MAADISNLQIAPTEPLDLDLYKNAGEAKPFPRQGRYTLRAPDTFEPNAFQANKAGTALTIQIDPTITGPSGEGRTLKFTRISAKSFQRGNTNVSQLGDYLKACGLSGVVPGDAQSQADLVERTAGVTYEADLNWRASEKFAGKVPQGWTEKNGYINLEGMEKFPQDANGNYIPYVESASQVDPVTGEAKRLWANLVIDAFIPRQ